MKDYRILVFALLVTACAGDGGVEGAIADETVAITTTQALGERAVVADRIDLAIIDPDNVIGEAEDCVVAALNAFLEGEVADLDADETQWVFWVGDLAGRHCGVTAGMVLDPLSGGTHLGEGDLFGP